MEILINKTVFYLFCLFFQPSIYIRMNLQVIILYFTLQSNASIFIWLFRSLNGILLVGLCVLLTYLHHKKNNFLIFWHYRMLQLTWYIPWPDRVKPFLQRHFLPFLGETILEVKIWVLAMFIATLVSKERHRNICVCVRTQLYLTLPDSMDCSLPNSSVRAIFSGEILEWVPIFSSRASFKPGHPTCISCSLQESTGRWILYQWTNREDPPVCIPTLYTRIYIDFF